MDRHMFSMPLMAQEAGLPVPELFKHEAYRRLTHFNLVTSQSPGDTGRQVAFGIVTPDSYGICYNPRESGVDVNIAASRSRHDYDAKRWKEALTVVNLSSEKSFLRFQVCASFVRRFA